ncbi:MAG TPA: FtsX-like permease family protein [Bacteroidales bacterium]|nr:FtsX-like permease family protein [Bacteroidales bacterium]
MIWKTAWKNVWRNRVRSIVVISSVAVGILAGVFTVAMMAGMINQRVDAALNEEISHIQITAEDFRTNFDPSLIIKDADKIISEIQQVAGVQGVCSRIILSGMANTATKSTGVQIVGIDTENEKKVFDLYNKIIPGTGDYFETESKFNLALVGQDLAKDLNIIRYSIDTTVLRELKEGGVPEEVLTRLSVISGERFKSEKIFFKKLKSMFSKREEAKYGQIIKEKAWSYRKGSRLILTFLDKDNNQVGAVYRVAGLYDIKNSMFEKRTVFVKNDGLKQLAGISEDSFHNLIVKIDNIDNTNEITANLKRKLADYEVLSWKDIQPDLAMMTEMVHVYYGVFMIVILAALAFGIVNTMLMVVLERTKEIGMLTAIGMNKKKVFSMIMLESVFMSMIGGVIGMIISECVILLTSRGGINFSQYAEGFEAMGYSAHIYPQIEPLFFLEVVVLIIITGILSSIYPARKALKLDPADAIRTE